MIAGPIGLALGVAALAAELQGAGVMADAISGRTKLGRTRRPSRLIETQCWGFSHIMLGVLARGYVGILVSITH